LQEKLGINELRDAFNGSLRFEEDLSNGVVSIPFRNITILGNAFAHDLTNLDIQLLYTANFVVGYRKTLQEGIDFVGPDSQLWAPDRGGKIIRLMAKALGMNSERMVIYRASRVPSDDGGYSIGIDFDPRANEDFRDTANILFADDCGAAGGTDVASLAVWMKQHGKPQKYAVAVGAGVRRTLHRRAVSLENAHINYHIGAAAEANVMDDHYYLGLTDQEKEVLALPQAYQMRVNDMGDVMSLETKARQKEQFLFENLTQSHQYDKEVLAITHNVFTNPSLLTKEAQRLRELLSH
jgi:hypothetical protein